MSFSLAGLRDSVAAIDQRLGQAQAPVAPQSPVVTFLQPGLANPAEQQGQPYGQPAAGNDPFLQPAPKSSRELELELELEKSNHKFSVLQGKYNKEIADLRNNGSQQNGNTATQVATPVKFDLGVPQEVLQSVDPDVVKMMQSTHATFSSKLAEIQSAQQKVEDEFKYRQEQEEQSSRMQTFAASLDKRCPGWNDLVYSENFKAWATQTGRRDALALHWGYPDGASVYADAIAIFRSETGGRPSTTLPHGAVLPQIGSQASPPPAQAGRFAAAEISAFYQTALRQVQAGQMTQAEYKQRAEAYDKAMAEGRVF